MMMHGFFKLFLSLALGYGVCVVAAKQKGLLKTVGYTLGIAILVIALLSDLLACCMMDKMCMMKGKMGGMGKMGMSCPMMKHK